MTPPSLDLDVAILGGGIAGLWTLAALRAAGYSARLIETGQLGGIQSIASQGIIHGGIKYALTGNASRAARAIAEMPALWHASLRGDGRSTGPTSQPSPPSPDLRSACVLSESQYLWTTPGIGSRLIGVAASKAIRTSVERVPVDQRPPALRDTASSRSARKFDVYRVAEPVLDVRSVVNALVEEAGGPHSCLACDAVRFDFAPVRPTRPAEDAASAAPPFIDSLQLLGVGGEAPPPLLRIRARQYVFAAGAGNQELLSLAGIDHSKATGLAMQRRPLHMVMLRSSHLPNLYGHCTGMSEKPRLTVTSARDDAGRTVWYIGGQLAEQGVELDAPALIRRAGNELRECLPWLAWDDLTDAQYATWRVDRAEGLMPDGSRPDGPVIVRTGNVITVWPTKLAFAPLVARTAHALLAEQRIAPSTPPSAGAASPVEALPPLRPASVAAYPWNRPEVQWTP